MGALVDGAGLRLEDCCVSAKVYALLQDRDAFAEDSDSCSVQFVYERTVREAVYPVAPGVDADVLRKPVPPGYRDLVASPKNNGWGDGVYGLVYRPQMI